MLFNRCMRIFIVTIAEGMLSYRRSLKKQISMTGGLEKVTGSHVALYLLSYSGQILLPISLAGYILHCISSYFCDFAHLCSSICRHVLCGLPGNPTSSTSEKIWALKNLQMELTFTLAK
ncbi:hypothetical protein STEG23_022212, partial [Scotinomys teguina]